MQTVVTDTEHVQYSSKSNPILFEISALRIFRPSFLLLLSLKPVSCLANTHCKTSGQRIEFLFMSVIHNLHLFTFQLPWYLINDVHNRIEHV